MTFRRSCLVAVTILLVSGAARAADREADAMIARGLDLRREGKPDEALEMFQRAHALAPSPRTFGQMGLVEGTLEHWTDAENHLNTALAATDDSWVKKNQALLQTALESVKAHIGQLVFSGTPGAAVTVAGKAVGTLPTIPPVRVAAGTVLVTASAPNTRQFVERVDVQAGMQTAVTINLQPVEVKLVPAAAPPAPQTPMVPELRSHYSWKTWTGGSLLTVGAALATWGIVWIAVDGHSAGGMCADTTAPDCKHVYDTKTPGVILTAGGAVAAAAGGFLLYSARSSGTEVSVSMGSRSVVVGGRF
jgi:hypothetical protein